MFNDTQSADRAPDCSETESAPGPLRELTPGRSAPLPVPTNHHLEPGVASVEEAEGALEALAADCRAKAEAARWAAERQRRIHERIESPDEDAPSDPALVSWAEALTDAFYWASAEDASVTFDIGLLDHVGGCFETLAEGLGLAAAAQGPGGAERALPLIAEAESAVRRSLQRLKAPDDPDQLAAYEWVRQTAARCHVFLKRFLRADDLANPEGWPGLLARIEAQSGSGPRSRRQTLLFDRLRSLCAERSGADRRGLAGNPRLVGGIGRRGHAPEQPRTPGTGLAAG